MQAVAEGGLARIGVVIPSASTEHAVFLRTTLPRAPIRWGPVIVQVKAIPAPFHDVAMHIVKPPWVGFFPADLFRPVRFVVPPPPGIFVQLAARIPRGIAIGVTEGKSSVSVGIFYGTSTRVFPLRLAGETIPSPAHGVDPGDEFLTLIPGNIVNGIMRALAG